MGEEYTITKNIAKHGRNSIIVIPSVLREHLRPGTTVKVTIEVIRRPEMEGGRGPETSFSFVTSEVTSEGVDGDD